MKNFLLLCFSFGVLTYTYCSIPEITEKCTAYKDLFGNSTAASSKSSTNAQSGEFPHVAALGYYDSDKNDHSFLCGAVIVSAKYVIAPAHCAVYTLSKLEIVRVGPVATPTWVSGWDTQTDYKIKEVKVHPNYNRRQHKNNIALIELEKDIVFGEKVRPACLDTKNTSTGSLLLTEWGDQDEHDNLVLHKTDVTPISNEECNIRYLSQATNLTVDGSQLCSISVCTGHLRGPLQVPNENLYTLVALPSFGASCFRNAKFPTVYTKIYNYLYWIESIVWP